MIDTMDFVPAPVKAYGTLIAVAVAAAAIIGGTAYFVHHERVIGEQAATAKCNAEKDEQHQVDLAAAQRNLAETQRRLEAQEGVSNDLRRQLEHAKADADAASDAAVRLRGRAAAYVQRAAAADSTAAEREQAAAALADALQRCTADYRQLAAAADESYARGRACEADYDALRSSLGGGQPQQPTTPEPNPSQATP